MKNILWLFLFSMLMSIESFGTLASYEADIQTLLSPSLPVKSGKSCAAGLIPARLPPTKYEN